MLDEEVHTGGHVAGGDGLHAAAVELAYNALCQSLLAQSVHADVIGHLLEQLVVLGGDVEGAALQRHQCVSHLRVQVDDETADGGLGGGSGLLDGDVRAHDPLLDAVLVHAGDGHLVQLTAQSAACGLLDGLIGLVQRVDGEGEGGLLLAGHLLKGVTHVMDLAEAVGAAAGVLGLRHGVHAADADGAAVGIQPGIAVAAVIGGDGGFLEALRDLGCVLNCVVDSHR